MSDQVRKVGRIILEVPAQDLAVETEKLKSQGFTIAKSYLAKMPPKPILDTYQFIDELRRQGSAYNIYASGKIIAAKLVGENVRFALNKPKLSGFMIGTVSVQSFTHTLIRIHGKVDRAFSHLAPDANVQTTLTTEAEAKAFLDISW